MITPNELKNLPDEFKDENYKFRTFLKNRVKEKTLDKQFLKLHNELLKYYNCESCRNCCKEYSLALKEQELESVAKLLQISKDEFINKFVKDFFGEYELKGKPCQFLNSDNSCQIESCKPECCVSYPHTNKPDRLSSLLGIIDSSFVCPVVFEMIESLKEEYGFKSNFDFGL